MMMTICEKFGTRGWGVEVGATVAVGAVVEVEIDGGGRVGRGCVGADSVNAG